MKKFIQNNIEYVVLLVFILWGLFMIPTICKAQTFEAPTKNKTEVKHDSTTTFKYKDHGVVYPVYKGKRGGFYIWRKGIRNPKKLQRISIPKDIQIKMGRKYN